MIWNESGMSIIVGAFVLVLYDYMVTFDQEVELIWP